MERLDTTAPRALRLALARQPTSQGKVLFAWSLAAGATLSQAAAATWHEGTLRLVAKSETWRRELVRARPELYKRLASVLGPGVVRAIEIVAPAWTGGR